MKGVAFGLVTSSIFPGFFTLMAFGADKFRRYDERIFFSLYLGHFSGFRRKYKFYGV